MNFAFWFSIVVGLFLLALATWGRAAASGAAVGVFFVLFGLVGFVHVRVRRLEETLEQQTKRKDKVEE